VNSVASAAPARRCLRTSGAALLAALLLAPPTASAAEEGWSFELTPYVWLTTVDGSFSGEVGGPDVPMSQSAQDVVSQLDFAFMLAGEVRNDRIALLFDILYVDLSTSSPTPFGALWSEADVDTTALAGTAAVAYRFYRSRPAWIDAYAGVRIIDVTVDATLEPGLLPQRESSLDNTLVDPIIGMRTQIDIVDGFGVSAAFDIGGFGLGTDLTWHVLGTLDYSFNDWFTLRTGYRHMSIDYSNDGAELDLNLSGPIIGAAFRF